MVNIIKKNKELLILIGILLAIGICVEMPSWVKGGYFVGGGDIKTQWYPFYVLNRRETINALKSGNLPFYSWILFLGNNIWASKTSYGFVDTFNLIFYLCRENYFWIYDFQVILKILTAGITFYLLIDYVLNNKKAALFSGVLYASSSYLIYFTSQSGFLSFVSIAPLYLLGMIKCIKENKCVLFIISTTLLFLTNYYLFFSITVLSPFIYLYAYYNIKKNFDDVIRNIFKTILYYIVGFLISGVFTIPSFLFLLQNERVGSFTSNPFFYPNLKIYLNILYSMFTPNQLMIYGNNIFDFNEHTLKELCLFSSGLVAITFFYFFFKKNSRLKKSSIALFAVMLAILFCPLFGSVLNGFSEVCFRWTYLYIAFEIFISSYVLFIDGNINRNHLFIVAILSSVILMVFFFIGLIITSSNFSDYNKQFTINVFVIVIILLYFIIISYNRKLLLPILVVEMIIYSILFGVRSVHLSVSDNDISSVNSVLSDVDGESIKDHLLYIDDNEGVFFRVYVDYDKLYWSFSRNMNLLYNMEGVMSYDSTYEPSFSDMLDINEQGIVKDIYWEYSIDDSDLLDFVSCKYALTIDEASIPFKNYEIIEPDYRGGIIISKNLDYQPIGISYSKRIDETNSFKDLKEYIVSDDNEIDKYLVSKKRNILTDVYNYNNQLEGKINSDENSFVVLKLSYDEGFTVRVNDKIVETYKCNGGMLGFPIEKGDNNIIIDFMPKGFKLGLCLTGIGFISFIIILFKNKIFNLIRK